MNGPYNNNGFMQYPQDIYYQYNAVINSRKRKKDEIRKLGTCTGSAVLLYLVLQYVLAFGISLFGLSGYYINSQVFAKGIEILLIIFSILPAFMIFGRKMQKISGENTPISYRRPKVGLTVLALFAGMGICMVGNYVTAFVAVFMRIFGYELSSPENAMPTGFLGVSATVVQVVFVAAIIEEICMRGYVMGNLRKYGDTFAIFVSSVVFALLHGNLIQAPFALIAGFALGYFCVKTNSLWTAVIIHAGNNLLSVVMSYIGEFFGDETLTVIYYPIVLFLIVAGVVCLIIFNRQTKNSPLINDSTLLSFGEKLRAFLSSPAIILALIAMLIITAQYIVPIEG